MPRTRSLGWSELKIGLMTLAAIAIAVAVIFLLSGSGGFFWQRYALRAKFSNVAGLKTGAPVRVSGVEVGSVKNIAFTGVEVEVRFELSREMQPHITDQSTAMIGSVSLLGEGSLDLTAAVAGTPIPADGYVRTCIPTPGQLADVTEQANQGLVQATELLKDIRAGKGTLGKLRHRRSALQRSHEVRRRRQCRRDQPAERARHARQARQRRPGLRATRRLTQEPPGDDDAYQQRRGEPRPPLE